MTSFCEAVFRLYDIIPFESNIFSPQPAKMKIIFRSIILDWEEYDSRAKNVDPGELFDCL